MVVKKVNHVVNRPGLKNGDPSYDIPVADDLVTTPGIPQNPSDVDFYSRKYPLESQNISLSADRAWVWTIYQPEEVEAHLEHERLQAERELELPGYRRELSLALELTHEAVAVKLSGRVDGLYEDQLGRLVIEEYKTVLADAAGLARLDAASHPAYSSQLRLYAWLLRRGGAPDGGPEERPLCLRLVFIALPERQRAVVELAAKAVVHVAENGIGLGLAAMCFSTGKPVIDYPHHLVDGERLFDKISDAVPDGGASGLERAEAGQDDDTDVRVDLADLRQSVEAILAGHAQVEDDQVRRALVKPGNTFIDTVGKIDVVLRRQQDAQTLPGGSLVVDDDDM